MNSILVIILDSCRYDSYAKANTTFLDQFGLAEKRYSYASWTGPSHFCMFSGLFPHTSPSLVYASEVYKKEYILWEERTGIQDLDFKSFVPQLWLPTLLQKYGYYTIARMSMPVLNPHTALNKGFDDYKLMPNHNSLLDLATNLEFHSEKPTFCFINAGETHYPYMLTDPALPKISGIHGVLKDIDGITHDSSLSSQGFFNPEDMERLHTQQIKCVEHCDRCIECLLARIKAKTRVIITADHGELFGESGYFGHGPVNHSLVHEVPYIEFTINH